MMEAGLLSLKWNNHVSSFLDVLSTVRGKGTFSDVTITCEEKFFAVHKLVICSCSDYFYEMVEKTECKHPIIVLNGIKSKYFESLLRFMYLGEVNVLQSDLGELIKVAEYLCIKGLAVQDDSLKCQNNSRRPKRPLEGAEEFVSCSKKSCPSELLSEEDCQTHEVSCASPTVIPTVSAEDLYTSTSSENVDILPSLQILGHDDTFHDTSLSDTSTLQDTSIKLDRDGHREVLDTSKPLDLEELNQDTVKKEDPDDVLKEEDSTADCFSDFMSVDKMGDGSCLPGPDNSDFNMDFQGNWEEYNGCSGLNTSENNGFYNSTAMTLMGMQPTGTDSLPVGNLQNVHQSTTTTTTTSSSYRTYTCPYCSKSIVGQIGHLRRHIMIHFHEKPFSCNLCNYKSNRKDNLRSHMFRRHNHLNNPVM